MIIQWDDRDSARSKQLVVRYQQAMTEPKKLYRVVQYDNGALYPVSNIYRTIAKARERRTKMLSAHAEKYAMTWDTEFRKRIPRPNYKPPIFGLQECEPEWGGAG